MTIFEQIATKIIKEQELIMGPVAWYEARKVQSINVVDEKNGVVRIDQADNASAINNLVENYVKLFGNAAKKICKDAVTALIAELSPSEIPASLQ